jgi:hypothetical protein
MSKLRKEWFMIKILIYTFILFSYGNLFAATYYIDYFSGNDNANGISKLTPWKRCPGMLGFNGSYSHSKGDRFIFKGGVTWPSVALPLKIVYSGESDVNPDYYGVDVTWYTGGAWSRPIFDAEYSNSLGKDVSTCPINISSQNYINLDNIEVKRLKLQNEYAVALIMMYNAQNIVITKCYVHDWSTGTAKDGNRGGIMGASSDVYVRYCTVSNTENPTVSTAIARVTEVSNCLIFDVSSSIDQASLVYNNVIHDIYKSFDPAWHENTIWLWGNGRAYNNHIYNVHGAGTMMYVVPCWGGASGSSTYVYNNIIDMSMGAGVPAMEVDPSGGSANCASVYFYNNTIITNGVAIRSVARGFPILNFYAKNNHVITTQSESTAFCYGTANCGTATTYSKSNNLLQTPAQASAQGYTSANKYAPSNAGCSSVGVGLNIPLIVTDYLGNSRSINWDIGAYQFTIGSKDNELGSPKGLKLLTNP